MVVGGNKSFQQGENGGGGNKSFQQGENGSGGK